MREEEQEEAAGGACAFIGALRCGLRLTKADVCLSFFFPGRRSLL